MWTWFTWWCTVWTCVTMDRLQQTQPYIGFILGAVTLKMTLWWIDFSLSLCFHLRWALLLNVVEESMLLSCCSFLIVLSQKWSICSKISTHSSTFTQHCLIHTLFRRHYLSVSTMLAFLYAHDQPVIAIQLCCCLIQTCKCGINCLFDTFVLFKLCFL